MTLALHKDEYKNVLLRTISEPSIFRVFPVCKSAVRVCEENVVFHRRDGCISSPILTKNLNILKIIVGNGRRCASL